jgi:hypothetical protein
VGVPRYGAGRVKVAAGDEITVEFPDGAVRTFLRGYVRRRRPGVTGTLTKILDMDDMPDSIARPGERPVVPGMTTTSRRTVDDALEGAPPPSTDTAGARPPAGGHD